MSASGVSIPEDLRKRIFFTLRIWRSIAWVCMSRYREWTLKSCCNSSLRKVRNLGLFNTFTGGALERLVCLPSGIMPYISASIIFQLLQTAIPYLEQLKKEGEPGRENQSVHSLRHHCPCRRARLRDGVLFWRRLIIRGRHWWSHGRLGRAFSFHLMTVITLMSGTCFVMWLGEQITERGIGNGSSLIIFSGIAAGIPSGAYRLFQMVETGEINGLIALLLVATMVLVIGVIVFLEVGQRRIPIQYSQRAPTTRACRETSVLALANENQFLKCDSPDFRKFTVDVSGDHVSVYSEPTAAGSLQNFEPGAHHLQFAFCRIDCVLLLLLYGNCF